MAGRTEMATNNVFEPLFPLNKRHAYLTRKLANGQILDVIHLTFGRARITVSESLDDFGTVDEW